MPATMNNQRLWSPLVRELVPYTPGEQPKLDNLLKLNTNESPFAPSPKVREAILNELANDASSLRLYPDPEASQLKEALAHYHQLPTSHVFLGNGSDEVLAHIFMAFFKQDKPILYPDITYSFYPVYCQLYQVAAKQVPLAADFTINVDHYSAINQPNGGIIIANPNAPTGILLSLAHIRQLLRNNPNSVVVIDEAYIDFGGESAIGLIAEFDNLVVCQTMSKSRALAGLRVGMALAQPHLIDALQRVKNSFNSYPLDKLAIVGAVASIDDEAYFKQTCNTLIANRETLVTELTALGFSVLPSAANFIFATHAKHNAIDIAKFLREDGIIVRHFNAPRIGGYLRITVGTKEQHERLLGWLGVL